jgi:hypothetical protein
MFDQLLAQLSMIVDFTVENDPDAARFIGDGLATRRDIDDGKTAHAERNLVPEVVTLVIRTPVFNRIAHLPDDSLGHFYVRCSGLSYESCDSTHDVFS